MELSSFTTQILRNFKAINPSLVVNEGNVIMTISESKSVVARAVVDEVFPQKFGIYDLGEFLSVVDLVANPQLLFKDSHVIVGDASGRSKVKYFFSDPSNLTHPAKAMANPNMYSITDVAVSFTLDVGTFNNLKRAASALGHTEVAVTGTSNLITLSVLDKDNSTSNVYTIDVDGNSKSEDFRFIINIANLRMIPADYRVDIAPNLISQFTSTNLDKEIIYWVALEKSSTYKP